MTALNGSVSDTEGVERPSKGASGGLARDLILTTLASALVLIGNALIASMLARRGVFDVFEPYNVAKRMANVVYPLTTLGLTVGAVRFIAAASEDAQRKRFVLATVAMTTVVLVAGSLVILLAPTVAAKVLVGETDVSFAWAVWAYSAALAVNAIVYSFYRAELRQGRANATNLFAMVFVPLMVVLLAPRAWDATQLLMVTALIVLGWNGAQLGYRCIRAFSVRGTLHGFADDVRRLVSFSVVRIPAGVITSVMLAIGPWIARSRGSVEVSAMLVTGMLVTQTATAALQAFGIVLLPRVSESVTRDGGEDAGRLTAALLQAGLILSLSAVLPLIAIAYPLVIAWLGTDLAAATPVVRIVAVSIPGVVVFALLRSVVDGAIPTPVNSHATIAGLAVTAGTMYVAGPAHPALMAWGYTIGQLIIGAWVMLALVRRFTIRLGFSNLAVCFAASAAVAGLCVIIQRTGELDLLAVLVGGLGYVLVAVAGLWFAPQRYGIRAGVGRAFRVVS